MNDTEILHVRLHFVPVTMRTPLKFGNAVVTDVTTARVCVRLRVGTTEAEGWGETPLNIGWLWPSTLDYTERKNRLEAFCGRIAKALPGLSAGTAADRLTGHPMQIGNALVEDHLPDWRAEADLPYLAALGCLSAFDLAIHDAFGEALERPTYETYGAEFGCELAPFLGPDFAGKTVADFLEPAPQTLPVWHLVGGLDPLEESDLTGSEPDDDYPVLLADWIKRDGLTCLKIKLRGTDSAWDYSRLVRIDQIAAPLGVEHLTADFNCTVTDPAYVNELLDRLAAEHPETHARVLYVEQPFPYELEEHPIDVHSVSERKPLFMDESAHDWKLVRMGRELGWNGVALKVCKTQTGALLSLCWGKHHGMGLMVQDLTNPMLAQIPHVQLAAHAGTIMGVESNGMQFYPAASAPEEAVHPGLYRRRAGVLDRSSLGPTGFGYRVADIERELPPPAVGLG